MPMVSVEANQDACINIQKKMDGVALGISNMDMCYL